MSNQVKLKIDGEYVIAEAGRTILDVARENGKDIPTLCHIDGLTSVGACRMCLVEVGGVGRPLPACTTPVQENMVVNTTSEALTEYRKMILELLLSERNHVCAACVSNGSCELQAMAARYGVTHTPYPYRYPNTEVDASHERFNLDHNRCILCTRCVRVCREVEGANVWNVIGRGIDSMIASDLDEPWGDSDVCSNCGKCVEVCPVGALAVKGKAVHEMEKRPNIVAQLTSTRGGFR